jgi:transcriptional regulator GlxA family with amidase domain
MSVGSRRPSAKGDPPRSPEGKADEMLASSPGAGVPRREWPVRRIAIFLFEEVEELDAVGPWEVLSFWSRNFPEDGISVRCISETGGPVTGAKGLLLGVHGKASDSTENDLLIHPGGSGTRHLMRDSQHLVWLREHRERGRLLASVCTGALVLAAAGLLRGRPATTHHECLDELRTLEPSVSLRAGMRFVDDGDVITSAGVSAGIDMALHLVRRFAGEDRARQVRRGIEYDPAPPV